VPGSAVEAPLRTWCAAADETLKYESAGMKGTKHVMKRTFHRVVFSNSPRLANAYRSAICIVDWRVGIWVFAFKKAFGREYFQNTKFS